MSNTRFSFNILRIYVIYRALYARIARELRKNATWRY